MFRIFNCLTNEHDWRLVLVAALICLLASLVAINVFQLARASGGRQRAVWIGTAGLATGCGIWATHFVAMLAYDPGFAVGFDIALTATSFFAAALITTAGLAVAIYVPHRFAGLIGGAIIGGAIIADQARRGNAIEYCMQRYRSYDPESMTYMGFDGLRHPCP